MRPGHLREMRKALDASERANRGRTKPAERGWGPEMKRLRLTVSEDCGATCINVGDHST